MIKKLLIAAGVIFTFVYAHEYLVSVKLTEERLEPLYADDFQVIGELENNALLLVADSELEKLLLYDYQLLDKDPGENSYYLVHTMDHAIDLSVHGTILLTDYRTVVLKIAEGGLTELMKERVMLRRLTLTPLVTNDKPFSPQRIVDPTIQEIVNLIDPDSVLGHVQRLQDFVTRYSTHDSCMAAAYWIYDKFVQYGCDTVYFQYHTGGHAPNVIGIKHGMVYPDDTYTIVCGHFDSFSYSGPDIAPGADDNASGTACAIEAARVMSNYDFEYDVRYIAFSGEEFGLYGSHYYADWAYAQGHSILGVLNCDMIAYEDIVPEYINVVAKNANPPCEQFADFYIAVADTYTTLLTYKHMVDDMQYSDHAPFWDHGYLGLLMIEDWYVNNPYYHSAGDTIGAGYNDNAFCTEVIQATTAALSIIAVPYETSVEEEIGEEMTSFLQVRPTIGHGYFSIALRTSGTQQQDIAIYDITGKLIRNFSDCDHVHWNGTDSNGKHVPNGVYFIRCNGVKRALQQKIIVAR